MPELTREEFDLMARRAGFDPADPHMDELFPDVQLMLTRMAVMDGADVSSVGPAGPDSEA
jgi:hypothetical protein